MHISWARLASFCHLGFISDPLIVSKFHNETHDPKGQENKIYTIVKGWFMFVREILHMYNLPSVFQLLSNPPSKNEWKRVMTIAVNKVAEEGWQQDVKSKAFLKYINENSLKVGRTYHIWSTVRNSIYDSRRAQLKSKLLTRTYILQGNKAVFNQFQVNPTCRLCIADPETRQHFISECSFLNNDRAAYSEELLKYPVFQSSHTDRSLKKNP